MYHIDELKNYMLTPLAEIFHTQLVLGFAQVYVPLENLFFIRSFFFTTRSHFPHQVTNYQHDSLLATAVFLKSEDKIQIRRLSISTFNYNNRSILFQLSILFLEGFNRGVKFKKKSQQNGKTSWAFL